MNEMDNYSAFLPLCRDDAFQRKSEQLRLYFSTC